MDNSMLQTTVMGVGMEMRMEMGMEMEMEGNTESYDTKLKQVQWVLC